VEEGDDFWTWICTEWEEWENGRPRTGACFFVSFLNVQQTLLKIDSSLLVFLFLSSMFGMAGVSGGRATNIISSLIEKSFVREGSVIKIRRKVAHLVHSVLPVGTRCVDKPA